MLFPVETFLWHGPDAVRDEGESIGTKRLIVRAALEQGCRLGESLGLTAVFDRMHGLPPPPRLLSRPAGSGYHQGDPGRKEEGFCRNL